MLLQNLISARISLSSPPRLPLPTSSRANLPVHPSPRPSRPSFLSPARSRYDPRHISSLRADVSVLTPLLPHAPPCLHTAHGPIRAALPVRWLATALVSSLLSRHLLHLFHFCLVTSFHLFRLSGSMADSLRCLLCPRALADPLVRWAPSCAAPTPGRGRSSRDRPRSECAPTHAPTPTWRPPPAIGPAQSGHHRIPRQRPAGVQRRCLIAWESATNLPDADIASTAAHLDDSARLSLNFQFNSLIIIKLVRVLKLVRTGVTGS